MTQEEKNKHYKHALVAIENEERDFICNILMWQMQSWISESELE